MDDGARPREFCCFGWLIAVGVTTVLFGGMALLGWLSHWLAI